jgi:hypothetical protein
MNEHKLFSILGTCFAVGALVLAVALPLVG